MVNFCCDGCQATLRKKKAASHLQNCGSPTISCIDCGVTFTRSTFEAHTSCVSEAEKYGMDRGGPQQQKKQPQQKPAPKPKLEEKAVSESVAPVAASETKESDSQPKPSKKRKLPKEPEKKADKDDSASTAKQSKKAPPAPEAQPVSEAAGATAPIDKFDVSVFVREELSAAKSLPLRDLRKRMLKKARSATTRDKPNSRGDRADLTGELMCVLLDLPVTLSLQAT